jgi:hypothetical protein
VASKLYASLLIACMLYVDSDGAKVFDNPRFFALSALEKAQYTPFEFLLNGPPEFEPYLSITLMAEDGRAQMQARAALSTLIVLIDSALDGFFRFWYLHSLFSRLPGSMAGLFSLLSIQPRGLRRGLLRRGGMWRGLSAECRARLTTDCAVTLYLVPRFVLIGFGPDGELDFQVAADELVGIPDFRQSDGTHNRSQVAPSDFLRRVIRIGDIQIPEDNTIGVRRAVNPIFKGYVFSRSGFRAFQFRILDIGLIPAGWNQGKLGRFRCVINAEFIL